MSLKERLQEDVKETMRARDSKKLGVLRLITAAIKQVEVDERIVVDDARMLVILDKLVKQRKESLSQFQAAGRTDLVDQEQFELDILAGYLPEPLSETEINALLQKALIDTGALKMSDMGKVMSYLKPLLQGRADISKVSTLIKAKLT